jgi:hypothetical protein
MRSLSRLLGYGCTLSVALAVSACDLPLGLGGNDDSDQLENGREKWRRRGPADYEMTLHKSCECLPPGTVRISVRNRVRTSVVDPSSGEAVAENLATGYPTVPELFDLIEDALDRDPHQLDVTYHEYYGYPLHITVDFEENVADDEFVYRVESLVER